MVRQWNSESDDCVTILSTISCSGWLRIQSVISSAQMLQLGEANFVLAGGMENLSQAPFVVRGARSGLKLGQGALEDSLMVALRDLLAEIRPGAGTEQIQFERVRPRTLVMMAGMPIVGRLYNRVSPRLFVATTGTDSDWVVKLIDVYPP